MKKNMKFEEAMGRLEEITALLSDQSTALDQALKLYSESVELSAFCSQKLDQAQLQLSLIEPSQPQA